MNVKKIIQIGLLTLIFIVSFAVFYLYFYENNEIKLIEKIDNQNLKEDIIESKTKESEKFDNLIENLEYKSIDNAGNEYVLKSKSANVSLEDENVLFLSDVRAVINLRNKNPIYIKASNAKYNKLNYDTRFYDEVEVNYENNSLNANNLDLFLKMNIAYIYNNILFANNESKLKADFIDFNLLSGDININMFNDEDRVKITNK